MTHQGFKPLTSTIWLNNQNDLNSTIKNFQTKLEYQTKETFGNLLFEIKITKARLLGVQKALEYSKDSQLLNLESELQLKLVHLLENEENLWKMKSRINWLSLGDRTASFFHTSTLIR